MPFYKTSKNTERKEIVISRSTFYFLKVILFLTHILYASVVVKVTDFAAQMNTINDKKKKKRKKKKKVKINMDLVKFLLNRSQFCLRSQLRSTLKADPVFEGLCCQRSK